MNEIKSSIKFFLSSLEPESALAKQFIPSPLENDESIQSKGLIDPIGDMKYQKTSHIIHRYKAKALAVVTMHCPILCRHCFRKNLKEGKHTDGLDKDDWDYLRAHPEIKELILTGGDPLMLEDRELDAIFTQAATIKHIKYLRIHSRMITLTPERITSNLLALLSKHREQFKQLIIVLHINHASECESPAVKDAVLKLKDARLELLSQSVLLKGVNDSADALSDLFESITDLGIRPYYLHHPDQVKGAMHFHLPLEKGRRLYAQLRDRLPGHAIPQYVIDIPQGLGKVSAFNPESYSYSGKLITKNGDLVDISLIS